MATEADRTETTLDATSEQGIQGVDYSERGSNPLTLVWYYLRRYPIIPIFVLALLLIAAIIGPYVAPFPRDKGFFS